MTEEKSSDVTALASRITALVKANGGSSAISRRAPIPLSNLTKYMAGKASPPAIATWRIARACGVGIAELFADFESTQSEEEKKSALIGRIQREIAKLGTPSGAASQLGIPTVRLRRILDGSIKPDDDFLRRLEQLAGLDEDALLGEIASSAVGDDENTVMVPVLDVRAAAGNGEVNHGETVVDMMPFSRRHLKRLNVSPDQVHAIHAAGDSMSPTIDDGGLVLVDARNRKLVKDGIYALVFGDQARIKRVQSHPDGSVTLISDNAGRYPAERLSPADLAGIRVVGRVFWTEKRL